jgi:hypothetical protein
MAGVEHGKLYQEVYLLPVVGKGKTFIQYEQEKGEKQILISQSVLETGMWINWLMSALLAREFAAGRSRS